MKLIFRSLLPAVLLAAALFACGNKHTAGGELNSLADISVNGPGVDGSVQEIRKVMYTLKDVHENQNYTLRTEIGLLPGGQVPDGTLTVNIYSSGAAYTNNPAAPVASAVPLLAPNSSIYEVYFSAPSSGDYVVVISGLSSSIPGIQFFYNLRIMTADPAVPTVFIPFTTATIPASDAQLINPLNPGYLNIYNGGSVATSGTFTINLISNATVTHSNPQIFVYKDSTLTINSLMKTSIPTATDFIVTNFNAGVPDNVNAEHKDANVITGVTFTSSVDSSDQVGGPFIVLKGFVGAVTYTLTIGP